MGVVSLPPVPRLLSPLRLSRRTLGRLSVLFSRGLLTCDRPWRRFCAVCRASKWFGIVVGVERVSPLPQ